MFGYVRPSVQDLPEGELNRFRTMYCGLCHTLSRRYGQAARFILNYDFTYLAILLSDGAAGTEHSGRCYTSPIRKRPYLESTAAMELAADESVILAYWQLWDGIADHAGSAGLKYRAGAQLLESAYRKAAAFRPAFDEAVRCQLQLLSGLERENAPSMDQAADTFAVLLSSAAAATARRSCWPPPLWWDFICGRRTCCCPLRAARRCIWFFFRQCSPDA